MNIKLILAASLLVSACVDGTEEDPIDESFIDESDGKEDAFGIKDGSADALGILQLVNLEPRFRLVNVGIGNSALNAILSKRPFANLKALDDAPYVGQATFAKLVEYARTNRYATPNPFDATTKCDGPPITIARLQELSQGGSAPLPTGATWVRTRQCNGALGCGPWSAARKVGLPSNNLIRYTTAIYGTPTEYINFRPGVDHADSSGGRLAYTWEFDLWPKPQTHYSPIKGTYFYNPGTTGSVWLNYTAPTMTFSGSCMKAYARVLPIAPRTEEQEVMFFATFD